MATKKVDKSFSVIGELSKAHDTDAGFDIKSNEHRHIYPQESILVSTGLKVNIPEGYVGLLWSRSGLAAKHGIEVGAGCIDAGYTGEVKVLLHNHGKEVFEVAEGARIAQLIVLALGNLTPAPVEAFDQTERGNNGFGSTGT